MFLPPPVIGYIAGVAATWFFGSKVKKNISSKTATKTATKSTSKAATSKKEDKPATKPAPKKETKSTDEPKGKQKIELTLGNGKTATLRYDNYDSARMGLMQLRRTKKISYETLVQRDSSFKAAHKQNPFDLEATNKIKNIVWKYQDDVFQKYSF